MSAEEKVRKGAKSHVMADATRSMAKVRSLLDAPLRVTLFDGRVLVGKFTCYDKQRNILLSETLEQRFAEGDTVPSPPVAPEFERHLGLVLVPRQHIAHCHAIVDEYS